MAQSHMTLIEVRFGRSSDETGVIMPAHMILDAFL